MYLRHRAAAAPRYVHCTRAIPGCAVRTVYRGTPGGSACTDKVWSVASTHTLIPTLTLAPTLGTNSDAEPGPTLTLIPILTLALALTPTLTPHPAPS